MKEKRLLPECRRLAMARLQAHLNQQGKSMDDYSAQIRKTYGTGRFPDLNAFSTEQIPEPKPVDHPNLIENAPNTARDRSNFQNLIPAVKNIVNEMGRSLKNSFQKAPGRVWGAGAPRLLLVP